MYMRRSYLLIMDEDSVREKEPFILFNFRLYVPLSCFLENQLNLAVLSFLGNSPNLCLDAVLTHTHTRLINPFILLQLRIK